MMGVKIGVVFHLKEHDKIQSRERERVRRTILKQKQNNNNRTKKEKNIELRE